MKKVSISTLIILVSHTFFFLIFSQSEGFCEEKLIALMSPKYAISIAGKDITAKFQPMNVGPYSGLALVLCSGKVNTLTVNNKKLKILHGFDSNCYLEIDGVGLARITAESVMVLTEQQKDKLNKILDSYD